MEEHRFLNNRERKRYELHVEGHLAIAEYATNNEGVICMIHTKTPVALKGRGIASELIEKSLQDIKEQGKKVYPLCPFVIAHIEKHPEWISLVQQLN